MEKEIRTGTCSIEPECAYHEAGHAYVLYAMGIDVKEVTIVPKHGEYEGLCTPVGTSIPPLRHCVFCLAGYAAFKQIKAQPDASDDARHKTTDYFWGLRNARAALLHFVQSELSSMDWTEQTAAAVFEVMDAPAHELVDYCELEATRLVQEGWNAIEQLADALRARKTLSGEEVRTIIETAMPGFQRRLSPERFTDAEKNLLRSLAMSALISRLALPITNLDQDAL